MGSGETWRQRNERNTMKCWGYFWIVKRERENVWKWWIFIMGEKKKNRGFYSESVDVHTWGHLFDSLCDTCNPLDVVLPSEFVLPGFGLDLLLDVWRVLEEFQGKRQKLLLHIIHVVHIFLCPGRSARVSLRPLELRENEFMNLNISWSQLCDVPVVESKEEDSEMR